MKNAKWIKAHGAKPIVFHWRKCQDVPKFLKRFDAVQKRTAKSKLRLP